MHLLELADFVQRSVEDGKYAYIASLDIDGAFDKVPHRLLVDSLMAVGIEGYLVRYMTKWLIGRNFRARLSSASRRFYSGPKDMTRGVPQGG